MEELQKMKGREFLGRLHIANLLKAKGHVKSLDEAFERFIGDYKPCYVPKASMTPREAVEMILKVKGIPVFAHPGLTQRDEIIPDLVKHGLMGIEVYHTEHSAQNSRYYQKIAQKHRLLETGGSDCHGLGKGKVLMGKVSVGYEVVEKLKELKKKIDERK
jgi:predicted metal-dependent phosphoesterase TrpH